MSTRIPYNKPIGPTFYSELVTAGLDDVLMMWRTDGEVSYDDTVDAATIALVEAVIAAHNANASSVVSAYVTSQGYNVATQSVPYVPGALGASLLGRGSEFLGASVTLGGVTDTVRAHLTTRALSDDVIPHMQGVPLFASTMGAGPTTTYSSLTYSGFSATESNMEVVLPNATVFKNLYVKTLNAQSGTGSIVVTLRINGVDTSLVVTVQAGAPAGVFSDITHSAVALAGARYSLRYVNNATVGSAQLGTHSALVMTSQAPQVTAFMALLLALDQPVLSFQRQPVPFGSTDTIKNLWQAAISDLAYGVGGWNSPLSAGDVTTMQALSLVYGIALV